jgi:O-acetyl-ADP-ribose deacetylase (regulator of RNase III)
MIEVVQGDIAHLRASGIVRPVSAEWDPVSAAARRIEIAAGPELLQQCEKLGDLPVGSAVLTSAPQLAADYIVHASVRSVDEQVSESTIHRAFQNALRRCVEWGIESLAVPPLGTGAGNLDADAAASIMVPVLLEHMHSAEFPVSVLIVVDSEYELDVFRNELARYDLPFLPAFPEPTTPGNEDG